MRPSLLFLVGSIIMLANISIAASPKAVKSQVQNNYYLLNERRQLTSVAQAQIEALIINAFLNPENSVARAYELSGNSIPMEPWSDMNQSFPSGACCPDFILKDAVDICPPEGACPQGTPRPDQGGKGPMAACKNTPHKYTVFPKDPTFTYVWTITGRTPNSFTGNPITITWGNGATGSIKVVISNVGVGGTCLDSITQDVCLIDGLKANFTVSNDTTCANTPIHITNTSLGGSVFFWDFGDGNTSNLANPMDHAYTTPGTYIVLLVTQDMGAGHGVTGTQGGDEKVPCGCIDSIRKTIVVLPGIGPVIDYDCCFGTVCAGDTSAFCTPMVCGTYNWSVTNGTIISGLNSNYIKVKWNATYSVPTTVSLQSCASSTCPGTATLNIPVLYPNLPISGPITVCVGSSGSYSLPWLPGTYYTWTVSGPGPNTFNQKGRNTTNVNITFSSPGMHWVKCEYDNPLAGCNGVDSILVNVMPKLAITGDAIVCEGNSTNYSVTFGPALWSVSPPGPFISGNGNQTVSITWAPPGN